MNQQDLYPLYLEAKERHPGMLLLIREGDSCFLFDSDAVACAKALGIESPATKRAAFAHKDLEKYLRKLLQAGHRVAICDQVEPHTPRGAEVNRIVTPGPDRRVLSPDGRVQGQPNTLAFIGRDGAWKQTPWMFD